MTKRVASNIPVPRWEGPSQGIFPMLLRELITEKEEVRDKEAYYNMKSSIRLSASAGAPEFIIALCVISFWQLVIDHLHIVGIFLAGAKGPPHYYGYLKPVPFGGYPVGQP